MSQEITELALFRIGSDAYGIDIDHIQEIDRSLSFTKVFNADKSIKGVINLRGQIVTIIDLRQKFAYQEKPVDPLNRIIIVKFNNEVVGLLVDAMEDIIAYDPSKRDSRSAKREGIDQDFFAGIYKLDKELVIIIDVERVLKTDGELING